MHDSLETVCWPQKKQMREHERSNALANPVGLTPYTNTHKKHTFYILSVQRQKSASLGGTLLHHIVSSPHNLVRCAFQVHLRAINLNNFIKFL